MTDSVKAPPTKPRPHPDDASLPFFEGAKNDRLMLQRCLDCGTFMWPTKPRCTNCWSPELEWCPSVGRGVLFSFSNVHQLYNAAFVDDIPYNVCLVELDEGVRMYSSLVGVDGNQLHVGMPVIVVFDHLDEDVALPRFTTRESRPTSS